MKEQYLYDPAILEELDFSECNCKVTVSNPGPNFRVRPLCSSDYERGYLELLKQLTSVGDVQPELFIKTFEKMKECKGTYYVTVVEDCTNGTIIATGTLLVEQKIIHGCALRGRIEDIVVSEEYRGKQLGKLMINTLTLLSKKVGAYKITLDCRDSMRPFYESLGYKKEEGNSNFMQMRFRD